MEFDLLNYPAGALLNITLPESQDSIPTLGKVGILGFINYNPPRLPTVKGLILGGVGVPVVTIKLNDGVMLRQVGINQEFISDQFLRLKTYAGILKQFIACNLQLVRGQLLLSKIHCYKLLSSLWVFIPATNRAIGRVILLARCRPSKRITANLTDRFNFIPTLPSYLMVKTTKEMLTLFNSGYRQVKEAAAVFTIGFSALLSVWPGGAFVTTGLAIFTIFGDAGGNSLAAASAGKGTELVLICHTDIIAQEF